MNAILEQPRSARADYRIEEDFLIYLQTRLRIRVAAKLQPADYARLLGMNLDQIAHAMSEGAYEQEARASGAELSGGRLIRAMIRDKIIADGEWLKRLCSLRRPALNWVRAYCWKYDLYRLRAAIRARRANSDMTEGMLSALANVSVETYTQIARGEAMEQLTDPALRDSPFALTISRALSNDPPSTDEIEMGILHDYYSQCIAKLMACAPGDNRARELLENEIHLVNLLTILSAGIAGASVEQTLVQIIPWGAWRHEDRLRALLASPDPERLSKGLRGMDRAGMLGRLELPEKRALTPDDIELSAFRALVRCSLRAARTMPPSPAAIIAYLVALEAEARNLCAIVAGLEGGVPPEEIRAALLV